MKGISTNLGENSFIFPIPVIVSMPIMQQQKINALMICADVCFLPFLFNLKNTKIIRELKKYTRLVNAVLKDMHHIGFHVFQSEKTMLPNFISHKNAVRGLYAYGKNRALHLVVILTEYKAFCQIGTAFGC